MFYLPEKTFKRRRRDNALGSLSTHEKWREKLRNMPVEPQPLLWPARNRSTRNQYNNDELNQRRELRILLPTQSLRIASQDNHVNAKYTIISHRCNGKYFDHCCPSKDTNIVPSSTIEIPLQLSRMYRSGRRVNHSAFIPQLFMVYRTLQALLLPCYLAVHNRGDILRRLISNCDYYKCGQTSRHVIKTSISTSGYVETSASRSSSLLASQLWCSYDNVSRLAPLHNIDQHHTICVSNDLDCMLCDNLSDSPSTSKSSAIHRLSSRA